MQKRKKRTIKYIVEIDCMTDFMEETICKMFEMCMIAFQTHNERTGKTKTKIFFERK